MTQSIAERFHEKTVPEPNSGCLLWLGPVMRWGYGRMWRNGKTTCAHRVAWELAYGPPAPAPEVPRG